MMEIQVYVISNAEVQGFNANSSEMSLVMCRHLLNWCEKEIARSRFGGLVLEDAITQRDTNPVRHVSYVVEGPSNSYWP